MNYGGDAADQIVRYSLEGTEVALKLTGEAAKSFAVFAAAVLKDQKKMHGRTNLTRLLRDGKPLTEMDLGFKEKMVVKKLLEKIQGTDIEKLLKEYHVI